MGASWCFTGMHPSTAYLRISEGPDDLLEEQRTLTRRLLTLFVAFILFSGTSLFAMAAFDVDHVLLDKALAASGPGKEGTADEDNSGPGGGDDDDDTQSGSSNSDDNGDGTSDSSTHQGAVRVKNDDSG